MYLMVSGRDDLNWLVEWDAVSHLGRTAPFGLPTLAVVLHPFTTRTDEVSWREVANAAGADLDQMLRTTPGDPRDLHDPGNLDGPGARAGTLHLPPEGYVPPPIRRVLRQVLGGPAAGPATVGLYGGYGRPRGIETDAGPLELNTVDYWFAHTSGTTFFTRWAGAGDDEDASGWEGVVAHVWPEDRRWLLRVDPDLCYTEVYGDDDVITQLEASSLEVIRVPVPSTYRL